MPFYRSFFFRKGDSHAMEELFCVASFLPKETYRRILGPTDNNIVFIMNVDVVMKIDVTVFGDQNG